MDTQACNCAAHITNDEKASVMALVDRNDQDSGSLVMSMHVQFIFMRCEQMWKPRVCPQGAPESCSDTCCLRQCTKLHVLGYRL